MSNLTTIEQGKTNAIISHFTIIGTVIAFVLNNNTKNSFTSFYVRQMIGLHILSIINTSFIYKFLGSIPSFGVWFILVAFWFVSFMGATQGTQKLVPFLGDKFQDWFKAL